MRALRRWIPCFLSLLLGISASGQTNKVARPAGNQGKHSLWKIQGKTNAVYLLGSIHFLKKEYFPMAAPIEGAFDKSSVVVFEADFAQMESLENQMKFLSMGQYPAGETLKENLSPDLYAKLAAKLGGTAAFVDGFKPWLAGVMLVVTELQKLGFDPNQGIDKYFYRKATEAKKKVMGLETAEFQMKLFGDLTKEEQEKFLKATLDDIDRFEQIFNDIVRAWETGDSKRLDTQVLESMRQYPSIYKRFLVDRNTKWVPQIESMVKEGKNVFVVVGAAHLVGSEGVVELLRKRGLSVSQL